MTFVDRERHYARIQVAAAFSQDIVPKIPCLLEYGLWRCENDVVFAFHDLFPCFLRGFLARNSNGLDTALLQVVLLPVNVCTQ